MSLNLPIREIVRRTLREGGILPEGTSGQFLQSQGPGQPPQWTTSSASALGIWLPDAPPASAGSLDDEFADASGGVPTGWTEMDFDSNTTVTEDEHGLTVVQSTHAGASLAGIYKSLPGDSTYTAWTKVHFVSAIRADFSHAGLFLHEDATSSTSAMATVALRWSSTTDGLTAAEYTDYNSFSSETLVNTNNWDMMAYVRVRYDATTWYFEWSRDGVAWHQIRSDTNIGFTPQHIGVFINNANTGVEQKAVFSFLRYLDSDAGRNGVLGGDRV